MASEEPKEHPIANNESLANGTVTDLNISFQDHHESSNDVVRHYSVHNRRNSLEIKEELSEKEMKALAELRERVAKELGPDHQVTNHKLLKFIVARKYDIDAALQQYVRMAQWRKKNHIDNWEKFGVEHLRKLVPESFHGFDKHGWPSYIVKAGKVNPAQVKRITVKDFILIHVWGNEISFNRAEDEGRKRGKYVDKFSNIVDMEGLSLKHRKLMGYLKAVAKVDEKYYPECLGHTFIVNAPWVFTGLWSLFKSWLDPVTVSKIDVLGSDYKEVLLKHYEPSQLPVEYGGTCVCDGGCVKVFSEEEIEAALSAHEAKLKLTTVTVKAGNTFSTVHEIGKFGASVSYYFRTDDADIKFGITFTPDDAKDQPVTVITADKVRSHRTPDKESFDLYKGGKMQLTWDNTYSYWKDKTLHFLVAIEEHEDHMEPDPDEVFPLPRQ